MGGSKMSAPGQGEGLRLHDLWVRNHRLRWGVKGRRGPGSRPSSWEQSLPEASTLDFPKQEWNRWVVPWGVGGQVIQGTLVLHVLVKTEFSSVWLLSHVRLFVTPWTAACQTSLSITNSQSLLKLMSIKLVMPSNRLILCHPLLPPSIFPSIRDFSNESVLIRWPKYWNFSFSISSSNEYSGLISFRMNWLYLLAVPGTLKSLLQHQSSKATILRRSENSGRGKVIDKKWFIRIGCLWGL